ncbi:hypothetical protein ACRPOS_006725 [Bartonella heixiaziensis]|uniref:hypothetical protein n=1 Tax=Bartonella heixiaziensis TaxID=1461000 RepID=UPI00390890F8
MIHPKKHAGEKSLKAVLCMCSPALRIFIKRPKTIKDASVSPVHILNSCQDAIEDSYIKEKTPKSLREKRNIVICKNDKQWKEALQKQIQSATQTGHFASFTAVELQKCLETLLQPPTFIPLRE